MNKFDEHDRLANWNILSSNLKFVFVENISLYLFGARQINDVRSINKIYNIETYQYFMNIYHK